MEQLKVKLKEAQEQYESFNPEDVYNTIIDAFSRTRQEVISYGNAACPQFDDDEVSNL